MEATQVPINRGMAKERETYKLIRLLKQVIQSHRKAPKEKK